MIHVIDRLGRDHRNLRLLLDIVEANMDGYAQGRTPDFDLLRLIVDYMLEYPDLVTTRWRTWCSGVSSSAIRRLRRPLAIFSGSIAGWRSLLGD
jgi:hypothetical protein